MFDESMMEEYLEELDKIAKPLPPGRFAKTRYKELMENLANYKAVPILIHTALVKYKDIEEFNKRWNEKAKDFGGQIIYLKGKSILCKIVGREPKPDEYVWLKAVIFPILVNVIGLTYEDVVQTLQDILPDIEDAIQRIIAGREYI